MSETNETATTHETIGQHRGIVHWQEPLVTIFPTEAERKSIVALFAEAMREYDTFVFHSHQTVVGGKSILWSSTLNEETDEIEIVTCPPEFRSV
ncbi:hypothetical protein [Tabrizicola sp. BL-A-41-H6]|uniref:hypothetical protein n=1 Tax=Tabrizicola sp. BL-A-41-H6 TaxID=3421107 RepID=UPI003D66EEB7